MKASSEQTGKISLAQAIATLQSALTENMEVLVTHKGFEIVFAQSPTRRNSLIPASITTVQGV